MDKLQRLNIRVTAEEKALAEKLADVYNLNGNVSELVRLAFLYLETERPELTITLKPKWRDLYDE